MPNSKSHVTLNMAGTKSTNMKIKAILSNLSRSKDRSSAHNISQTFHTIEHPPVAQHRLNKPTVFNNKALNIKLRDKSFITLN